MSSVFLPPPWLMGCFQLKYKTLPGRFQGLGGLFLKTFLFPKTLGFKIFRPKKIAVATVDTPRESDRLYL